MRHDLFGRALGYDPAAVYPRAGADIEYMVGSTDGILVMLYHDHGVAQIAQLNEGLEQPVIVALMQTDGGLVENVHHTHQAGADLAGQAYTLSLASGKGLGAALQSEIVKADVNQKFQPGVDFVNDLLGDLALASGQGQLLKVTPGLTDGKLDDLGQGAAVDKDVARFLAQT